MRDRWFEDFFQGVALDFWTKLCPEAMTQQEVDTAEKLLQLGQASTVLDVPCGPGRHSLELGSRGFAVKAADIAEEAIAALRKKAARQRLDIETQRVDMRHITWENCCDGAICLGNSFGYMDRRGTEEYLDAVGRALKPGKRFLIDSGVIAESLLPSLDERNWYQVEGITLLVENEYQVSQGALKTEYTFIEGGRRATKTAYHYVFTVSELTAMLETTGFEVEGLFSSTELEPYKFGDPRLLLLARKSE